MRKSLWDPASRNELIERLGRMSPDKAPLWGKMNASQMLAHIGSSIRMARGEIPVASKKLPIRFTPIKQLIIYWLPFPKGAPTAPELMSRVVTDWNENMSDVRTQIASFETCDRNGTWPEHPAFGSLSASAWGVLGYRHIDHHFRQFGV
jgi:hypothetical protein